MSDHHNETANMSPLEIKFNDCINRAEDFMKIEIYSSAKKYYKDALDLHFNDSLAQEKLNDVTEKQSYERKTIIKILVAAVVIVGIYLIYSAF